MFIGYTIACQQKFALRFCSEKHTNPFRVLLCDDYLTNHCFKYNKKTSIVIFTRKIPLQSIIKFILMCNALAQKYSFIQYFDIQTTANFWLQFLILFMQS